MVDMQTFLSIWKCGVFLQNSSVVDGWGSFVQIAFWAIVILEFDPSVEQPRFWNSRLGAHSVIMMMSKSNPISIFKWGYITPYRVCCPRNLKLSATWWEIRTKCIKLHQQILFPMCHFLCGILFCISLPCLKLHKVLIWRIMYLKIVICCKH